MTSASASLELGDPYHIGLAVHDLDDAMKRFGEQFGIAKWAKLESDVPSTYRGADTVAGIRSAFARQGPLIIELVQPTTGNFTAKTFLEERGEGVYHLGYWVEDMHAAIKRADKLGIGVDWIFPSSGDPFAVYLDAAHTLGMHIELVSPAMRPILDQAMEKA